MGDISIQEIENKKQSLRRYKKCRACIARLRNKLALLETRLNSIGSPNYSGMPRGGIPVTMADLVADKEDLENRIKRLERKSKNIKNEILSEIDSLEDERYCELLEAYFIDCLPLETIADNMGYTERHIYTLYKEAIVALTKISN